MKSIVTYREADGTIINFEAHSSLKSPIDLARYYAKEKNYPDRYVVLAEKLCCEAVCFTLWCAYREGNAKLTYRQIVCHIVCFVLDAVRYDIAFCWEIFADKVGIDIEECCAVFRVDSIVKLQLCLDDSFNVEEGFKMLLADGCDDTEIRMDDVAKFFDFALVTSAHFDNEVCMCRL